MIKLSTKGRYGTRLMLNLGIRFQNEETPVVLKDVSQEEDISIRYLEQIIIPLKIKKLVKSIRGAGGGHSLAKPPQKIKLLEIIEALEGPLALVDCLEDREECGRIPFCATYEVWKEASALLKDFFQKKTLQDLIEIWKEKNARE